MGTQGRLLVYKKSCMFALRKVVEKLSEEKGRPVSSKDLREGFKIHPEDRPALIQNLGQCLIKAARPQRTFSAGVDRLYRIGLIGNLAYYTADNDPKWPTALEKYRSNLILAYLCSQALPEHLPLLRDSDSALAAAAGRVWVKIASAAVANGAFHPRFTELLELARAAGAWGQESLNVEPISRVQASGIIEKALRDVSGDEGHINLARHLAHLAPPLFTKPSLFTEPQVRSYCRGLTDAISTDALRHIVRQRAWTIILLDITNVQGPSWVSMDSCCLHD